jgi:hypothetical protein
LKNCPETPGISPTGKNTATIENVVATTASPISSAASIAAWNAVFPIRMWRTIFSISTIASSTSTPATRPSASSDSWLSVKPNQLWRNQKVGIADKGMAIADTSVARQSRRKKNTTITARTAPSTIDEIDESYCFLV